MLRRQTIDADDVSFEDLGGCAMLLSTKNHSWLRQRRRQM